MGIYITRYDSQHYHICAQDAVGARYLEADTVPTVSTTAVNLVQNMYFYLSMYYEKETNQI